MDERLVEKFISSETIYDGHVVHLEKWCVELPNGRQAVREVIKHVGAAAVLAINDAEEACMVRQYRAALGHVTLEIPAGKLNHSLDDPLEAAKRELSEETGLSAERWMHLGRIFTTVGFCDERIDLYLATGLSHGIVHPDEDEFIEVKFMPYSQLLQMAMAGEITDGKSLCALLLAQPKLQPNSI